jgi:Ca2+-binding RTX toxin-like protein
VINGGGGNDTIKGGSDADTLTGGPGNNTFVLAAVADSIPAAPDTITDFFHGQDKLDFSAIDANTSSSKAAKGDQAFLFAGQNADVVANSVSWLESGSNTIVQADVSGDTTADISIVLIETNLQLSAWDFIL